MMLPDEKQKTIDVKSCIDRIENEIYRQMLKPLGFRKYGRTLHRFVSGDISQVVGFQCGESYREETHLMWVRPRKTGTNSGVFFVSVSCEFEKSEASVNKNLK